FRAEHAASDPPIQASRTPHVTILKTDFEMSFISRTSKLELPSKSIIATEREINGLYNSPKPALGSIKPNIGPINRPAIDIMTIDVHLILPAIHCEKITRPKIMTILISATCSLTPTLYTKKQNKTKIIIMFLYPILQQKKHSYTLRFSKRSVRC